MTPEEQRRELLRNFDRAEQALRVNLRLQRVQNEARAHTERALSHTLEAYIATNAAGTNTGWRGLLPVRPSDPSG